MILCYIIIGEVCLRGQVWVIWAPGEAHCARGKYQHPIDIAFTITSTLYHHIRPSRRASRVLSRTHSGKTARRLQSRRSVLGGMAGSKYITRDTSKSSKSKSKSKSHEQTVQFEGDDKHLQKESKSGLSKLERKILQASPEDAGVSHDHTVYVV